MADRRKYEDILADLRSGAVDPEEAADELEQGYGKSQLREQAGKAAAFEKERDEALAKVAALEKAPVRDKAFRDYGIDFENLRPAEREQVERYDGEFDAEKIGEFVERYDLPTIQAGTEGEGEEPPPKAAGVVAAARSAPARQQRGEGTQITAEMVGTWDAEKWLRFKKEHPDAAETILQGQVVTGIAFS
jgi:hypothetical protein